MYVSAILLAAGRGLRSKSKISKPLIKIDSKPVIFYSLKTLSSLAYIKDIVVVANTRNLKGIVNSINKYRVGRVRRIVYGGKRRQDSVYSGIKAIDKRTDLVLIHDVARPFIDKKTVISLIREAKRSGAAIAGVPVKATIKSIKVSKCQGVRVEKTLDRSRLWEIQTPQVFKKSLILKAYKKFNRIDVTDDAMLVEKLGCKVSIVHGSYSNIKITNPEDILIAKAILKAKSVKRRIQN
ncbi:MAG: 2-C-methyl-D-erythritol 4-phosphate cytidylyltransferase [Candidatus Omnitrophota bacterium]